MKSKIILVTVAMVILSACQPKTLIKTEYIERKVPVNSVPQPPVVAPPVWETTKLTAEDRKDIGKVAKALTVEDKQKDGFIDILLKIINSYKQAADKSELQSKLIVPGVNDGKVTESK